jgi:L-cysteine desulfidase
MQANNDVQILKRRAKIFNNEMERCLTLLGWGINNLERIKTKVEQERSSLIDNAGEGDVDFSQVKLLSKKIEAIDELNNKLLPRNFSTIKSLEELEDEKKKVVRLVKEFNKKYPEVG